MKKERAERRYRTNAFWALWQTHHREVNYPVQLSPNMVTHGWNLLSRAERAAIVTPRQILRKYLMLTSLASAPSPGSVGKNEGPL